MPRVNGNSPGQPIRSMPGTTAPGGGPYTGSTSSPDKVVKSASRLAAASKRRCQRCWPAVADRLRGSLRAESFAVGSLA